MMGAPTAQAKAAAQGILSMSKKELEVERMSKEDMYLQGNGERIFELAKSDPYYRNMIEQLRLHHVEDGDIREWHNLSNVEKRVMLNSDKTIMLAEIRVLERKGHTKQESAKSVLKHHATFTGNVDAGAYNVFVDQLDLPVTSETVDVLIQNAQNRVTVVVSLDSKVPG